jgi:hypothetical protein
MSFQYGDKYCRLGHFVMGELTTDEEYLALWDDVFFDPELVGNGRMFNEDGLYNPYWDCVRDGDNIEESRALELRRRHVELGS